MASDNKKWDFFARGCIHVTDVLRRHEIPAVYVGHFLS